MRIIKNSKDLKIVNLDQLAHGTGAKYLEVMPDSLHGTLIAVCWRRKLPKAGKFSNFAIVEF